MRDLMSEFVNNLKAGELSGEDRKINFGLDLTNEDMLAEYVINKDDPEGYFVRIKVDGEETSRFFLLNGHVAPDNARYDYPYTYTMARWVNDCIKEIIFKDGFMPYLKTDGSFNAPFDLIARNIREVMDIVTIRLREEAPHVKLRIVDAVEPDRVPVRHTVQRRETYDD